MRLLASEGVFAESEPRRFELTPLAMPLQSDVPGSLRARAIFDGEEAHWQAWGDLMHSVATGEPAFDRTHGVPFFEYMKAHAAVASSFNTVMTDQNAAGGAGSGRGVRFLRARHVGGRRRRPRQPSRRDSGGVSAASRHPL